MSIRCLASAKLFDGIKQLLMFGTVKSKTGCPLSIIQYHHLIVYFIDNLQNLPKTKFSYFDAERYRLKYKGTRIL